MKKISVHLQEKSYPIYIGYDCLQNLGRILKHHKISGHALIVTQKEVWSKCGKTLKDALSAEDIANTIYLTTPSAASEQSKSVKELLKIVGACSSLDGKDKGFFIIAFGGGVIGDVAGFAASIYRRGIPYIQIPTSVTAQVDSSIGGKTAVDLPNGKNLLGTVYQPRLVIINPFFLQTLNEDDYRDGLAEIVKYSVIKDEKLFYFLEKNKSLILSRDMPCLTRIIASCVKIKAKIVSRDEFDNKEIRMVLNFGHTIGHAIESSLSYGEYTHGQAISIGMMIALEISEAVNLLKDASIIRRVDQLFEDFGLPITLNEKCEVKKIMHSMNYDKKNSDGVNRLVLIEELGRTVIRRGISKDLIYDGILKRIQPKKIRARRK